MLQQERGTHECFIILHLKKLSGGQHQQEGMETAPQTALKPPFDCRQVSGRRAN